MHALACGGAAAHWGWDQPRIYIELLRLEEEREQFCILGAGFSFEPRCSRERAQ